MTEISKQRSTKRPLHGVYVYLFIVGSRHGHVTTIHTKFDPLQRLRRSTRKRQLIKGIEKHFENIYFLSGSGNKNRY